MAMTRGRNTRKCVFTERCACGRALGAHLQRASARRCTSGARRPGQDNGNVVPCPGAWGQSCGGPMWSFWSVLLLFLLTFQLEQTWLYWNFDFLNGLKLVFVSFRFFGNYRKMEFYEQKGLQAWSTVHMNLDKICKVGIKS